MWVLIGKQLLRCSVHSVRPVSETERFEHETSGTEDPGSWKSLADLLPKREYYDIVDQVPDEQECEIPDLPEQPDSTTTVVPRRRLLRKTTFKPGDYTNDPVQERLQHEDEELPTESTNQDLTGVNDYGTTSTPATSSSTTRHPLPASELEQTGT